MEIPILREMSIIIIGFGFSGQNLARSAKEASVPYIAALEKVPSTKKTVGSRDARWMSAV